MIPKDSYPSEAKILRVVSINVNGLRSSVTKGLLDWLEQSDADVVCMQESRITHEQWTINLNQKAGIHISFQQSVQVMQVRQSIADSFLSVRDGLGFELADSQGRFICAEFDLGLEQPVHIASLYLPSGSSGEEAQIRKDQFLDEYKKIETMAR
jgi:exodeoxyribonuclease-3